MKYTPDGYGERCRFDAFCKTVLRNEARTHLRDLGRQRSRETEFSALSQQEMDKLCRWMNTQATAPIHGLWRSAYPVTNWWPTPLPVCQNSGARYFDPVLCVGAADGEIGSLVGMSRSASTAPHQGPERCGNDWRTKGETEMTADFLRAELLPLSVIERRPAAVILWPWSASCGTMSYMDKLCPRTLYDLDGTPRVRGGRVHEAPDYKAI